MQDGLKCLVQWFNPEGEDVAWCGNFLELIILQVS